MQAFAGQGGGPTTPSNNYSMNAEIVNTTSRESAAERGILLDETTSMKQKAAEQSGIHQNRESAERGTALDW